MQSLNPEMITMAIIIGLLVLNLILQTLNHVKILKMEHEIRERLINIRKKVAEYSR